MEGTEEVASFTVEVGVRYQSSSIELYWMMKMTMTYRRFSVPNPRPRNWMMKMTMLRYWKSVPNPSPSCWWY